MRNNIKIFVIIAAIFGWGTQAYAWCGKYTHTSLTEKAIFNNNQSVLDEYIKTQLNIEQGLSCELSLDQSTIPEPDRIPTNQLEERISSILPPNPSVMDLLKAGSHLEDVPTPRSKHHFHDPYRDAGIDNKTEHPSWAAAFKTATYVWYWGDNLFDLTGALCLKRALGTEDPKWEEEYENYFAWPDTRDYFYRALTQESESAREHYLALTFLTLGHVLHLLEDMSVPAHVRNDFIEAHFRGLYPGGIGNPLESWAEEQIKDNGGNIPSDWLNGWTPQAKVFSELAHYWDVNDYIGQYVGSSPLSNWGLSEQTDYQFLSKSTIFRKNDGTKYYFPHPDANNTSEHIDTEVYLWGLVTVDHRYISGYDITHLARTKFTQKYAYLAGIPYPIETVAYHTTFDEAVYEDYAKVTMPRTIDYATGLSNYFFRGRLNAEQVGQNGNDIILTITNTSENSGVPQTLKGGTFELYWDGFTGNRTKINDFTVYEPAPSSNPWNSETSTLAYNQFTEAHFIIPTPPPGLDILQYVLVYKGNICQGPNVPDLDDQNAIATLVVEPSFPNNDCCCFLNPNIRWDCSTSYNIGDIVESFGPSAWDPQITYDLGSSVQYWDSYPYAHQGFYCSKADNNLNHHPTDTDWWTRASSSVGTGTLGFYRSKADNNISHHPIDSNWWKKVSNTGSCDNPNWNAWPGYGGIGKTPKFITVVFQGITLCTEYWDCTSTFPQNPPGPDRIFVLQQVSGCGYRCTTQPTLFYIDGLKVRGRYEVSVYLSKSQIMLNVVACPIPWESGQSYQIDDWVICWSGDDDDAYAIYTCLYAHISTEDNKPGGDIDSWHSTYTYNIGNLVRYYSSGAYRHYRSLQNNNHNHSPLDPNWWEMIDYPWMMICRGSENLWCSWMGDDCGALSKRHLFYSPNSYSCVTFGTQIDNSFSQCRNRWQDRNCGYGGTAIIEPGGIDISFWTVDHSYVSGDMVIGSDEQRYICKLGHISTYDDMPIIGTNWQTYWWLLTGCY